MTNPIPPRSVAVIGAGVAGLAAAHRLWELDRSLNVVVLESGDRPGGVLQTERVDGFLVERGADNFITNVPWAVDLCRRVGLGEELLETNDAMRRAFVVRRGRLLPIPAGFTLMSPRRLWPLLTTPLLSPWGKLRLLAEYFIPPRKGGEDESLADFARRRLGREAYQRLVQPLVAGIYTADAEKLSVAAALPRFVEMEREHGGLIRAGRREAKAASGQSGARYSLFVAPREGMSQLVDALARRLPPGWLRLNSPVERLERRTGEFGGRAGWSVFVRDISRPWQCGAVIVATPASRAAGLLEEWDPELAGLLREIPYAGSVVASLGYRRGQVAHPLDGFGFVVPEIEGRSILAGSFSSIKFPGRAPDGHVLIRVFLGGATRPELVDADESELREIVAKELAELVGATGQPCLFHLTRWPKAMPQYHIGHLDRLAGIEEHLARHPPLELAGSAYRGVGIPHAIHSGESAAERLMSL